jgi:hypothetical protein
LKEKRFSVKVVVVRRKTTVYLDDELLRAAKIDAARSGKRDYQVFEETLRADLGRELLEQVGSRSDLTEEQALDLAYRELHQSRRSKIV